MAISFIDGFDMDVDGNDLARRGWQTGTASLNAPQTGRFGGLTLRLTNGNNTPLIRPVSSRDTIAIGFAYKGDNISSYGGAGEVVRFRNGTTDIMLLGFTGTGAVRVSRGNIGTSLGQSAGGVILNNVWHYIEMTLTRNASTGSFEVFVDGVSVLSATGQNTGASSIDGVGFNGGYTNQNFDDVYVTDTATRIGECRVETLRPSADSSVQFTPNASTNVSRVNTTTLDGDTTYNASSTVGHKDLFDMGDLSSTPTAIYAVQTMVNARKDDAATREVRTNLKSGATTVNGTTLALAASYTIQSDVYENDPNTSAPWTASGVNASQLGYEVVT